MACFGRAWQVVKSHQERFPTACVNLCANVETPPTAADQRWWFWSLGLRLNCQALFVFASHVRASSPIPPASDCHGHLTIHFQLPRRKKNTLRRPASLASSGAVAYAVTSHGLRVTQRERGRIVAQRVEAPYLASASSGSWRSGSGQEREEWRMVVASLGVSKEGGGGGKVVERVLSVSFMTDPVFKPTDLAGKGAAAMASLFGSVGSAAANLGSSISSGSSGGSGGGGGGGSGVGKASGGAGGSASGGSLSAVEIANARSNQRAESLLQAIVAELGEVGWGGGGGGGALATASADQGTGVNSVVVPGGGAGARPPPVGSSPEQGASEEGEAANGAKDFACAVLREEVLVLAPFAGSSGGGGGGDTGVPAATAASSSSPFSPEEAGGKRGAAEERQDTSQQGGQEAEEAGDGVGKAGAGAGADGSGDSSAVVEVGFCLGSVVVCTYEVAINYSVWYYLLCPPLGNRRTSAVRGPPQPAIFSLSRPCGVLTACF